MDFFLKLFLIFLVIASIFFVVSETIPKKSMIILEWFLSKIDNEQYGWLLQIFLSISILLTEIFFKSSNVSELVSILVFVSTLYFYNDTEKDLSFRSCIKIISLVLISNILFKKELIDFKTAKVSENYFEIFLYLFHFAIQYAKAVISTFVYIEIARLMLLVLKKLKSQP